MADFRKLKVDALRVLARKMLGEGCSRLKTKRDLIEALDAAERKGAGRRAQAAKRARKRPPKTKEKQTKARAKSKKRSVKTRTRNLESAELTEASVLEDTGLDPEGYFVARVRGEEEARLAPHPMTEVSVEDFGTVSPPQPSSEAEEAGELPWAYEDDALVALPRDPRTVFLYWDFARATLTKGYQGLGEAHPQIWVFVWTGPDLYQRIRVVDIGLEARCYYLHDLEPGRRYRAEIHLLNGSGGDRLLGSSSNDVELPPLGPSPSIDDRFSRIPWEVPLPSWNRQEHSGQPFSEESRALLARLSDPSRFSGRVWGNSGGGRASPGGEPPPWEPSREGSGT